MQIDVQKSTTGPDSDDVENLDQSEVGHGCQTHFHWGNHIINEGTGVTVRLHGLNYSMT